jgi:hypothetical protein
LTALRSALASKDIEAIDRSTDGLEKLPLGAKERESLEKIADHILLGEYDFAAAAVDSFLRGGA